MTHLSLAHLRGITQALALGLLLACGGETSAPAAVVTPPTPVPVLTWVKVWSDEFDGPAAARIDSTKWSYELGDGCKAGICGWGNSEKEFYTDTTDNVSLNGQGQLAIVARQAVVPRQCYYGPCRYTSAKITTRGKMTAAPGRVEARIKIPGGQGLWPAFWMLGRDFPAVPWPACGELDIMENKGSNPSSTSSAIHGPGYSGATPFGHAYSISPNKLSDDFHLYAIEWNAYEVRFLVDSTAHYVVTPDQLMRYGKSVLDQSYFVILNLAVGGNFDGDPGSNAIFPATMLVDYVRVYRAEMK